MTRVRRLTTSNPDEYFISLSFRNQYRNSLGEYRAACAFGSGYKVKMPKKGSKVTEVPPNCVPVYESSLDLGLRFPLHPFITTVLYGYELGIWQLTPNSWTNILGYIATCELRGYPLSFAVFCKMHTLTRVSSDCDAWFVLSTKKNFMMTAFKPSKWDNFINRFFYIEMTDTELVDRLACWNATPYLVPISLLFTRTISLSLMAIYSETNKSPIHRMGCQIPKTFGAV